MTVLHFTRLSKYLKRREKSEARVKLKWRINSPKDLNPNPWSLTGQKENHCSLSNNSRHETQGSSFELKCLSINNRVSLWWEDLFPRETRLSLVSTRWRVLTVKRSVEYCGTLSSDLSTRLQRDRVSAHHTCSQVTPLILLLDHSMFFWHRPIVPFQTSLRNKIKTLAKWKIFMIHDDSVVCDQVCYNTTLTSTGSEKLIQTATKSRWTNYEPITAVWCQVVGPITVA